MFIFTANMGNFERNPRKLKLMEGTKRLKDAKATLRLMVERKFSELPKKTQGKYFVLFLNRIFKIHALIKIEC